MNAQILRQRLHDGLCQQLAGCALLQSVLVRRLEKLGEVGSETSGAAASAREVEGLLRAALDEAREIMRELG